MIERLKRELSQRKAEFALLKEKKKSFFEKVKKVSKENSENEKVLEKLLREFRELGGKL